VLPFFLFFFFFVVFSLALVSTCRQSLWKCPKIVEAAENVVIECGKVEEQSSLTSLVHSLAQLKAQIKIVEFEISRINAARGDRVYADESKSSSSSSSSSSSD
jgi:hypothetical protein